MLFRNRRLVRGIACLLLLETVSTLAAPSVSLAMMGPGQPEFTSYEASGSPDLVNLTTGDFTYNIPVLDVPGPERSFSLPLTYRAGIKLEQEASWVGLGWSLNAGAIARSLTGYPDDAAGELMKSTYNQKITRGWNGGVPGVLELGWDVNTGHSGSASLIGLVGLGWSGGGISSGDLVGIHVDKNGVTPDWVGIISAGATIASLGIGGPLAKVAASAASQLGTDVGTGVAASMLLGKASGTENGFNQPTVETQKGFLHTNYWVYYNDQKSEFMYGSLHFGDMSQQTKYQSESDNPSPYVYNGSTSGSRAKSPEFASYAYGGNGSFQSSPGADLYQYNAPGADYWANNSEAISIAHDDFSVMGGNVSGSIRPYRLEVGSLSFPYNGLSEHHRFAAVPYLPETDYKVPFRYENSVSNSYDYHQFTPSSSTTTNGTGVDGYYQPYSSSWTGGLVLRDPSLYGSATRTAPARKGVINGNATDGGSTRRLVQGKNIRWFTNKEILDQYLASADGNGSLLEVYHPVPQQVQVQGDPVGYTTCSDPNDYTCQPEPIYQPTTAWQNNPWRVTLPGKGIGAFAITAEDGTTYHYSLPVYHYTQFSKSYQRRKPEGVESAGVSTQTIGPQNWDIAGGGFATTWLLTAITSSDYVDRGTPSAGTLGVVDDGDWGGWVRFDYGKFSSAYKWRQPYLGESYSPDSYNNASFSEGYKETYYLNTIHTRSHTALFLKSIRNDARGHYQEAERYLGITENRPSSSLRLDEIILLNNEDYRKLQTVNGMRSASDTGADIPALFTTTPAGVQEVNPGGNCFTYDAVELRTGTQSDTYQFVFDQHDVNADSRIRTFLNQQALKRVVFNYSYRLCGTTPNSFASATTPPNWDESQFTCTRLGKLTLESLSTYGPANTKLTPDFKFTYGFNPDYQKDAWDGFGMYKSGVSVNNAATNPAKPLDSHQVSTDFATATRDASAWSLTGIMSPLGGQTTITYERDQYGKVSEYNLGTPSITNSDCSNVFTATGLPAGTTLSDFIKAGDVLSGSLYLTYIYQCQVYGDCGHTTPEWCESNSYCGASSNPNTPLRVVSVSGNTITIDSRDIPTPTCSAPNTSNTYQCSSLQPYSATLTIPSFPANRNGGDLRVASIATQDEAGHAYQVRYRYDLDQRAAASSGVISKEPTYVVHEKRPFDEWFDYPGTSVMYGRVRVLRGLFRAGDPNDYSQAEEYAFQTPTSSFIQQEPKTNKYQIISPGDRGTQYSKGWRAVDGYRNATTINLGMIGQPLAIRKLNRRGEVESSTAFEYSNAIPNLEGIARQGYFTEGVLTNELLGEGRYYYRINRSTKTYVPTMLVATTTKTNGVSTRSQQEKFDFYTGSVLESSFRNYLGDLFRSKTVPAYTLPNYAAMGPSSEKGTNRNMLTQQAASYMYKVQPNGTQAIVSAGVQTWNGNWATYRGYDAGSGTYVDRADDPRPIWRLQESYAWNLPRLNADGTYANFIDFDWTRKPLSSQAAGWFKAGEFTRYDHYSKPLESKDLNGQYVSRKLGYGQTQRLVTAANARYAEVAYSGAEDQVDQGNGALHFGGEVRDGGRRSTAFHHTGLYATKLQPGEAGFTYKTTLGSQARGNQKYRLSCWVHQSDAGRQAQLYAQVNGTDLGVATIASATTKQAGEWYLLTLLVDVPASGQLTAGCRAGSSSSTPVYVDDFRFRSLLAPTTAYVYDPASAQVTYVLDNENLFTRYEYDAAGKVTRVSKEALTTPGSGQLAERRVKEYQYNFARATDSNWLPTGFITWQQGAGGPTTQRQHEEQDINPLSSTYNTKRLVIDGNFPMCAPACPGTNQTRVNGECLTWQVECVSSVLLDACPADAVRCTYKNTFVKRYSNGTSSAPFDEISDTPCGQ